MNGQAIVTIGASVVALVQLCKWTGLPDKFGPVMVLAMALLGVLFWGWSIGDISRASSFAYFSGWIAVATSASGVYGFTRAGGDGLTRLTTPPVDGAGSSPTIKS